MISRIVAAKTSSASLQSAEKLSVAIGRKRHRHAKVALGAAALRSKSVTGPLRADLLQAFLKPIGQLRQAEQVLCGALVGALARCGHSVDPFGSLVVATADPGQRHKFGCFIDVEIVDQLAEFLLGEVFGGFFGEAVVVVAVASVTIELDLVLCAVIVVLVDGGAQRLGLEDEQAHGIRVDGKLPFPVAALLHLPFST
ncbi:conserved hypothetical protein [Mesorhizobium sp. ORS 3324]|nr:conserved hypothetical protein [Mesorhizobium sp. ORS 3324]